MMQRLSGAVMSVLLGLSASGCFREHADAKGSYPILYDQRDFLAAQDVSGLEVGIHEMEFGVYVPAHEAWTEAREQQVIQGIRVAHVDTRTEVKPRVRFSEVNGQNNLRRVHVAMALDLPGTWVLRVAGGSLRPVQMESELLPEYKISDAQPPEMQKTLVGLSPGVALRTLGPCNHIHKVTTLADEEGVLRRVRLTFSEPISREAWTGSVRMDLFDVMGKRVVTSESVLTAHASRSVEFDVAAWPDIHGLLKVRLGGGRDLAGGFGERLACAPAEAIVDVGYSYGSQHEGEYLVSPLSTATTLAFEEPK
ncbi:hypothetical protein [Melittangium boletus]|uniref:hypothetical protein n=1 Tax=Melittangium boletus TaxID=83453 RepID=UPI003DA47888